MINLMKSFIRDEEGQDLVEYALLLVFLALAALRSFQLWVAALTGSSANPTAR